MAVKVQCPYCQDAKLIRDVRAGSFKVPCTKCRATLRLIIRQEGEHWEAEVQPIAPPPSQSAEVDATTDLSPSAPAQSQAPTQAASRALTVEAGPGAPASPTGADGFSVDPGLADDTAPSSAPDDEPDDGDDDWPRGRKTLGGYARIGRLGRGGMGAVYKARQMSLDRDVAVKVMNRRWAHDGKSLSRFTREAYAAAQLLHHNVVQIYDVGVDHNIYYFSMEFVDGESLDALIRGRKRVPAFEAVGYILQAARGLKVAHDQGMIHRDIKPANLMLNAHGLVKIADLGLVKAPGTEDLGRAKDEPVPSPSRLRDSGSIELTLPNSTMGTPMYMAPEQARDASRVDARADIYALGCTLYALVTGRPPFDGKTVAEVLTKHANEPIPPPEGIVKDLPADLSAIIGKMMAKDPAGRYQSCAELIPALEEFQARHAPGGLFRPGDEEVRRLEDAVERFNAAPAARLRTPVVLGGLALGLLIAAMLLVTGNYLAAIGFLGLIALTMLAREVVEGVTGWSPVLDRLRALLLGCRVKDWVTIGFGALAAVALAWALGLTGMIIGFAIVAVALAVGYHFGISRPLALQRDEALAELEEMIKSWRLKGMAEEEIRAFVADHAGRHWEELFESLFGYDAKLIARSRSRLTLGNKPRPKFGAWREPIIAWADRVQRGRQAERDRKALQAIEMKALLLQGEDDLYKVRKAAERASRAMVHVAEKARQAALDKALGEHAKKFAMIQELEKISYDKAKGIMRVPEESRGEDEGDSLGWLRDGLDLLLGPSIRFIVGSLLLAAGAAWLHQNDLIPGRQQLTAAASEALPTASTEELAAEAKERVSRVAEGVRADFGSKIARAKEVRDEPLRAPFLPPALGSWFGGLNVGFAGLLLIASAFVGGWKMSLFAVPAALIAWLGPHFGIPDLSGSGLRLEPMAVGAVVFVLGLVFGRSRR